MDVKAFRIYILQVLLWLLCEVNKNIRMTKIHFKLIVCNTARIVQGAHLKSPRTLNLYLDCSILAGKPLHVYVFEDALLMTSNYSQV